MKEGKKCLAKAGISVEEWNYSKNWTFLRGFTTIKSMGISAPPGFTISEMQDLQPRIFTYTLRKTFYETSVLSAQLAVLEREVRS